MDALLGPMLLYWFAPLFAAVCLALLGHFVAKDPSIRTYLVSNAALLASLGVIIGFRLARPPLPPRMMEGLLQGVVAQILWTMPLAACVFGLSRAFASHGEIRPILVAIAYFLAGSGAVLAVLTAIIAPWFYF